MARRYVRVPGGRIGDLCLPEGAKVVEVAKAPGPDGAIETRVRFEHPSYPELPPCYCVEIPFRELSREGK